MSLVSGVRRCLPQACLPRWPLTHLRPPCCGFKLKHSLLSHFLANWSWYWRFCKICVSFYPEREIDMNWGKHAAKSWDKARCWRLNRITCCFQKKVGSNFSPQLTWNTKYYQAWKYFKNLFAPAIHSKSEKVCGTAFPVKKIAEKVRKSGRHFWAIWG